MKMVSCKKKRILLKKIPINMAAASQIGINTDLIDSGLTYGGSTLSPSGALCKCLPLDGPVWR